MTDKTPPSFTLQQAIKWLENGVRIGGEDGLKAAWHYVQDQYRDKPFFAEIEKRKDELKAQLQEAA